MKLLLKLLFGFVFAVLLFFFFATLVTENAMAATCFGKMPTVCPDIDGCFWYKGTFGEGSHCAEKFNTGTGVKCGSSNDGALSRPLCYADQDCIDVNSPTFYCAKKTSTPTPNNDCEAQGTNYYCRNGALYSDDLPAPFSCGNNNGTCFRKPYASVPTATPAPGSDPSPTSTQGGGSGGSNDSNSCVSYNNIGETFSCKSACDTTTEVDKGDAGVYSCSQSGTKCCMNKDLYKKYYGTGIGTGTDPTSPPTGGGTNPGSATTAPANDFCAQAGKGTLDKSYGGYTHPGYNQPSCEGKLIKETDPKTAVKGRKYADRYQCSEGGVDGKKYVDIPGGETTNYICDSFPWIDAPIPASASCKAYQAQSCKMKGTEPDYSDPNYCCAPNQNLKCDAVTDPNFPRCQYKDGLAATPTPGASTSCAMGQMQQGCRCDAFTTGTSAGGCLSSLQCEPSYENLNSTSNKMFCVPFPVYAKWCENTQTLKTTGLACTGATPYASPTTIPSGLPCPNDGNHLCAGGPPSLSKQCIAGFSPSTNAAANAACSDWNPDTPFCLVKTTGTTVCTDGSTPSAPTATPTLIPSTTPTSSVPKPTPFGCPIDNGDGRVNSCQASCGGSYPNSRPDSGQCKDAYGPDRAACCTSN